MAYYGELITRFGRRVKDLDVTKDPGLTIAGEYVNSAIKYVYSSHPFEYRFKTGQTTLIPNYTSGTAAVTKFDGTNEGAARTVTFSGATLTTSMQGRFFNFGTSGDWHRIQYVDVSASTIYLETPVLDASGSGTYKIWKRFYYLPGDVAVIHDFGRWNNRWGRLEYKSFSNLIDETADVSDDGTPEKFSPFGVDNYEPTYSAGTVSGNKDENLLTGSGTTWLGNVLAGDEVVIGTEVFHVKRVETNTRIILTTYLVDDIAGSTTYTIKRNLSIGFSFFPNEISDYITIPFYYLDKMFDLKHSTKDRANLPDDFDEAILSRAEFKIKKDKQDNNWPLIAQLAERELDDAKMKARIARPRSDTFGGDYRGMPGR